MVWGCSMMQLPDFGVPMPRAAAANESLLRKRSSTKWPLLAVFTQLSCLLIKARLRLELE